MSVSKTLERQASVPGEFLSGVGVWVPPHPDLKSKDEIQPICISIRSIDNLPVKESYDKCTCHMEAILYDSTHRRFFGRKWIGPSVAIRIPADKPASLTLDYRYNLYFYTSTPEAGIVLVFELVLTPLAAAPPSSNPLAPQTSAPSGPQLLGWGVVRPFRVGAELPESGGGKTVPVNSVEVAQGTPRALLLLDEPFEPQLRFIGACRVQVALSSHTPLTNCAHYIGENMLVGSNESVPGILPSSKGRDPFWKPHAAPSTTYFADRLQVFLHPSLEAFEKELLADLAHDRNEREAFNDPTPLQIAERRLRVGVHNGWTYVDFPEVAHMRPDRVTGGGSGSALEQSSGAASASGGIGAAGDAGGSKKQQQKQKQKQGKAPPAAMVDMDAADQPPALPATCLSSKYRIELTDLIEHRQSQVVFLLEYVVTEPVSGGRPSLEPTSRTSTRRVVLRMALCNPLVDQSPGGALESASTPHASGVGREHTLKMRGGPLLNPEAQLLYRAPLEGEEHPDKWLVQLRFRFYSEDEAGTPGAGSTDRTVAERQLANLQQQQQFALQQQQLRLQQDQLDSIIPMQPHPQMEAMLSQKKGAQLQTLAPMPPGGEQLASSRGGRTLQSGLPATQPLDMYTQQQLQLQQLMAAQQQRFGTQLMAGTVGPPHTAMASAAFFGLGGPMQLPPSTLPLSTFPKHGVIPLERPGGVSRSTYARLYSAGFPLILDRNGNHADLAADDPNFALDVRREDLDPLQINELVLQFLAFSHYAEPAESSLRSGAPVADRRPESLFFTFQMYRFPQCTTERLELRAQEVLDVEEARLGFSPPFVLQRAPDTGAAKNISSAPLTKPALDPGYMLRFALDPLYMKPGERTHLLRYLSEQTLHIDVWDGDSLLLVGSCALELKRLCRQGREAVQVSYELDVVRTEYFEEISAIPDQSMPTTQPIALENRLQGKLHVRVGNVGFPSDPRFRRSELGFDQKRLVIRSHERASTVGGSLFAGTSYDGRPLTSSRLDRTVSHAATAAARSRELAEVLATRRDLRATQLGVSGPTANMSGSGGAGELGATSTADLVLTQAEQAPDRKRKLARMAAVRQGERGPPSDPNMTSYMSMKMVRDERSRDLQDVTLHRSHMKHDGILNLLSSAITTEHTIYPSMGQTEFFQLAFTNPSSIPQTVLIQHHDAALSVVIDPVEWRFLKALHQVNTPIEENLFSLCATDPNKEPPLGTGAGTGNGSGSLVISFFARPQETIYVPFKYFTLVADHSVIPVGPPKSDPFGGSWSLQNLQKLGPTTAGVVPMRAGSDTREVRVQLVSAQENKLLSVLLLHVMPQPHALDQTFRFYHPEQTFMRKAIRLPPLGSLGLPGVPVGGAAGLQLTQLVARSSDANVLVETRPTAVGEPQDVFLKVACGPAPSVKRFFVALYPDLYLSRPLQIWQFYVHCLQRVDVACSAGQQSHFGLILRGSQTARLSACYSSHPGELAVSPSDPFLLSPNSAHELQVALRSGRTGNRFMLLNAVDVEFKQLLRSWLVCVACRAPTINRAFEVQLPASGGRECNKRIAFTNPYSGRKRFLLRTNRSDLLRFREEALDVGAGASEDICLVFLPVASAAAAAVDVLVFVNDEDEKTEEAFCVRVRYVL